MKWQMVAHPVLGPHMYMDYVNKDYGVHEDAVHVQERNG
jgi:hypothetical protein